MWATNDNKRLAYFRFLHRHIGSLVRGVPPISIAFCKPDIYLGKVTKTHCLIFSGFRVLVTKVAVRILPLISNTRINRHVPRNHFRPGSYVFAFCVCCCTIVKCIMNFWKVEPQVKNNRSNFELDLDHSGSRNYFKSIYFCTWSVLSCSVNNVATSEHLSLRGKVIALISIGCSALVSWCFLQTIRAMRLYLLKLGYVGYTLLLAFFSGHSV